MKCDVIVASQAWAQLNAVPGRTAQQCRERWHNRLAPSIKHLKNAPWTADEDAKLKKAVELLGAGHWSAVQRHAELSGF